MTRTVQRGIVAAIAVLATTAGLGQAAIVDPVSLTPTGSVRTDGPYMIGYDFTVGASNITIDSIGVEDIENNNVAPHSYGDGTFSATQVGIWNSSGTLLGSATIKSATASPLINGFRYERLSTSVTLLAGQTYTIGAQKGGGVDYFLDSATPNYAGGAGVTLGAARYNGSVTFAKPVTSGGAPIGRWSGGNATSVNEAPIATPALFEWAGVGTTLTQRNNHTGMVGYQITTGSTALNVTALGFFDHNLDGLASSHQVGIWDASGSTLLASVTVPSGTTATAYEFFRYVDLSSALTLAANTSYLVGAFVTNGGDIWYNNNIAADFNPSTDPLYTGWLVDNFGRYNGNAFFSAPTLSASPTSHYFLAANLLATPVPVVLVPAPAALPAGIAMIALTLLRRRRGA